MKKIGLFLVLLSVVLGLVRCTPAPAAQPQVAVQTVEVPKAVVQTVVVPKEVTRVVQQVAAVPSKAKKTIGYAGPDMGGAQVQIQQGLVDHAKPKTWAIVTVNANNDAAKQADQMDYLISLGVDAIVVVPVDSSAICTSVKKAHDANIPVYTIDRAPLGCAVEMTVMADNAMGGQQAAQAIVDRLTQRYGSPKGTVLEIQADQAMNVMQLRSSGFEAVFKQYPNIQLIVKPGQNDLQKWNQIATDVVSNQQIDAIYEPSGSYGWTSLLAILDQLKKKFPSSDSKHIILTGIDGSSIELKAIKDGWADETSSQPIPDFGIIVDWIEKGFNGEKFQPGPVLQEGATWSPAQVQTTPEGPQLLLATTAVTSKNVDNKALWGNQ